MKRGVIAIFAMTFLLTQTLGQQITFAYLYSNSFETSHQVESQSLIDLFFLSAETLDKSEVDAYQEDLNLFIERMAIKGEKTKDQSYFLKTVFYKAHNKYLKNYKNYVTFGDLFDKGNYDCVSGTALYALILDGLGFEYQVFEFNFHALLLVQLENDQILFESTDFNAGFVEDEVQIKERIEYYRSLNDAENDSYYSYQKNTNRIIDSKQLAGLLFYNLAVKEYNQQNLSGASAYLDKAETLYKGNRTAELRILISKMTLAANTYSMQ